MKKFFSSIALAMVATMILTTCVAVSSKAQTAQASSAATVKQGPVTELTMVFLTMGPTPADIASVEEELAKITVPKINARVKLLPINIGAAMQQYNLMLSSGEKVDLMLAFPYTYQSLVSQGKVQEIGPLLNKYGKGVKDALGKFMKGSIINGKIYGVTPLADKAGGAGLAIRKDIVDKYKLNINGIKKFEDIGNVLKQIKAKDPKATPLTSSGQGLGLMEFLTSFDTDRLGDGFGVLMNYGKGFKVVNLYNTSEYVNRVKLVREWYKKGYLMKDVATDKESYASNVASGKAYAWISNTKPGQDAFSTAQVGMPIVVKEFSKGFSTSTNISLWQWVVPNACETPDKAIQMLNLMYTDSKVENLLAWGIEGKHYEKKADGTIGFPAGVTDKTSGYFVNEPFMFGNEFLTHVWTGNAPDIWNQIKKYNSSAAISKAMGFTYDPTPVKTEVAALTNVYNQYKMGLEYGTVDVDKVLPQFQAKLKAAGIDKVIAEKQRQLNAWILANHIR